MNYRAAGRNAAGHFSRPGDHPAAGANTRIGCIRPCAAGPPPGFSRL